MDSYAIRQQRPLTPPNDRNKDLARQHGDVQNIGDVPSFGRQDASLSDRSHLSKVNAAANAMPPVSTAPSAPSATAANAPHYEDHKPSILSDAPTQSINHARKMDDPFNDVRSAASSSSKYGSGRNDTTQRIENEVVNVLKWKNPVRSGSIFTLLVGSIIMTRWYSLVQISSSLLTIAIGINLIYVNFILQGQKLVSTNQDASHPYNNVIHNEKHNMIDRQSVRHYSTILTEVSETMIRALTRIVFIENTATSVKWMTIFFVIWKVSAHVSTMDIVLAVVISAFVFPRLYISNKDVVDAQIQKGQTLIQNGIEKVHHAATTTAQDTYVKSRAAFAKAGTTGTDAKNTMSKESVTIKED
ncbi:Reticulon-domain-containing protein [Parasitella parasitica]|nr:Reticulon-domain-containing protein [Parasitella parasitica]